MTDRSEHSKKVESAWDSFWYDISYEEKDKNHKHTHGLYGKLRRCLSFLEAEYNLDRWIKEIISEELPKEGNICVLEAGCGEGKTANLIWKPRFRMIALDISEKALKRTVMQSKEYKTKLIPLRGNLFEIPIQKNSFDIVLSVGVLEHFLPDQQQHLYGELVRVTKENGLIFTFVPSFYGIFYRLGMWYAQRCGVWPFGYEKPLRTVKEIVKKYDCMKCTKEISGACLTQFYYLMFFFRKIRVVKMGYLGLVAVLNRILWHVNHLTMGGYYILNIAKKMPEK